MGRKPKLVEPLDIYGDHDARLFVAIMFAIVLAVAAVTYWPF